jgi:hypothetical protein
LGNSAPLSWWLVAHCAHEVINPFNPLSTILNSTLTFEPPRTRTNGDMIQMASQVCTHERRSRSYTMTPTHTMRHCVSSSLSRSNVSPFPYTKGSLPGFLLMRQGAATHLNAMITCVARIDSQSQSYSAFSRWYEEPLAIDQISPYMVFITRFFGICLCMLWL